MVGTFASVMLGVELYDHLAASSAGLAPDTFRDVPARRSTWLGSWVWVMFDADNNVVGAGVIGKAGQLLYTAEKQQEHRAP